MLQLCVTTRKSENITGLFLAAQRVQRVEAVEERKGGGERECRGGLAAVGWRAG